MAIELSESASQALLMRWRPVVIYDSREPYRADSPAVFTDITDNPSGNALKRSSGEIIAVGDPGGWTQKYDRLDLGFLSGGSSYADGLSAEVGDHLDATGNHYALDAARMHSKPKLGDRLCARLLQDGATTWLQYHFFYYYNEMWLDWHEGDWEMIQIGLDEHGDPQTMTCAQHRHCETRQWSEVRTTRLDDLDVPEVYPAIGSHATYFEDGVHWDAFLNFPDRHDGGNARTRVRPELIFIEEATPWIAWPGRWGGTDGGVPHTTSPVSPAHQGEKWSSPTTWAEKGHGFHEYILGPPAEPPEPSPPQVRVESGATPTVQVSVGDASTVPIAARITLEPTETDALPYMKVVPFRAAQLEYEVPAAVAARTHARVSVIDRLGAESVAIDIDLASPTTGRLKGVRE